MKLIFDFDDVLLNSRGQFKEHMFSTVAKAGVPRDEAEKYYKEVRESEFSLKNFLATLFKRYELSAVSAQKAYKEIMKRCPEFVNKKLVQIVKKAGKENCYIVTNGGEDFQHAKIKASGIWKLFDEVFITPGSKKDLVESVCEKNKNEKIIFIDDKPKFFADLDLKKLKNLKTILWDKNGYKKLLTEIGG